MSTKFQTMIPICCDFTSFMHKPIGNHSMTKTKHLTQFRKKKNDLSLSFLFSKEQSVHRSKEIAWPWDVAFQTYILTISVHLKKQRSNKINLNSIWRQEAQSD